MWKAVLFAAIALLAALLTWSLLKVDVTGRVSGQRRFEESESRPDVRPVPPRPRRQDEVEVPESRVFGHVLDGDRRPIAGARVNEARTDAEGRFELPRRPPECDVVATGYLPLQAVPFSDEYRLVRAAALSGRVVDESGAPVPGADIYVLKPEHPVLERLTLENHARSDGEGVYLFPGLRAGRFDVGVRAVGYLPALQRSLAIGEGGQQQLDLVVRLGRAVSVRVNVPCGVLGHDSRLGNLADLFDLDDPAALHLRLIEYAFVYAEGEERILLTGLPPGPCDFKAFRQGYLADPGLGAIGNSVANEIVLTLVRGVRFPVRALDAVSHAELKPTIRRRTEGIDALLPYTEALVPADARKHALVFELPGYETRALELPPLQEDQETTTDVYLEPLQKGETGSLAIRFEPELAGRLAVIGRDARSAWQRHADASDDEGTWLLPEVPAGEFTLTILASRKVPVVLPNVLIAAGDRTVLTVRLATGGGLALKVADADGRLLDQVHLALTDAQGQPIDMQIMNLVSEGRGFLSVNYVPAAGEVRADSGLAPGAYSLAASREGYEPSTAHFSIRDTEVAEVSITLRKRP